jgi:hypothetical protein
MGFYSGGFGWHPVGPDTSVSANTLSASCLSSLSVGDFVYISGPSISGVYQVALADITDYNKMPAVGVITEKPTTTTCTLQWHGEIKNVYTGLTPHRVYFLDESARPSLSPPTSPSTKYIQALGVALSSDTLLLTLEVQLTKRSAA